MRRNTVSIVLLAALAAHTAPPALAAKRGADPANRTAAADTRILLFNLPPAGAYDIRHNGAPAGSATAGPTGSISHGAVTHTGDQIQFILTGIQPVTPSAPAAFTAAGNNQGCASLSWNTPPSGEYVTDYALLWGSVPGVYTDSLVVARLDVIRSGTRSLATKCGFATGTYHFALRAHNSFDLWGPLSAPSTTTITNTNTQGPTPPTQVSASESPAGCARVAWRASSDPTVTGYRVYAGTAPRAQAAHTDSVDVGDVTTGSICGLAPGRHHLSVRSRTAAGLLSAYSTEVSLTIVGPDVTPPVLSNHSPAGGATGVWRNASVFFVVTDARSGVDGNSITVRLNGVACPITRTPTANNTGWNVQCSPAAPFAANADILVEVTADDGASPANSVSEAWTFRTSADAANDVEPPVITATSPAPDADDVPPGATIEVTVTDDGLGIDLASLVLEVNGVPVTYQVTGTPASARMTYKPTTPFVSGSAVQVRVEACDHASPSNCAVPLSYAFTVGTGSLAGGPGSIVPNGFWADDPARPMEVRNLPPQWRVRIFDAAGTPVRRFENTGGSGTTWTWDFTNDSGQRVAPALYLVRVTDAGGALQGSGKFLVQSDR